MSYPAPHPVQECKKAYVTMIDAVNKHFTRIIPEKFIKANDELLIKLTIDDLVEREEGEAINENEFKDAKANRGLWIKALAELKTNEEKAAFAALTVYRNSGVAVLHLNNIEHIAADVAYPYLVKMNNKRENNEMMLNHILLISKLLKHYNEIFALGYVSFLNRDSAAAVLDGEQYVNLFRVSFSRLGELVHSEFVKVNETKQVAHSLMGSSDYNDVVETIRYTFTTADCKNVVLKLIKPKAILDYICKHKQIFSPYYVEINAKNVEECSRAYGELTIVNNKYYQ